MSGEDGRGGPFASDGVGGSNGNGKWVETRKTFFIHVNAFLYIPGMTM